MVANHTTVCTASAAARLPTSTPPTMPRLVIVSDEKMIGLIESLKARVASLGELILPDNLGELAGPSNLAIITRIIHPAKNQELLLWCRDSDGVYAPAWSSMTGIWDGSDNITADRRDGLIHHVFTHEHGMNAEREGPYTFVWTNLEPGRGRKLMSMFAAPVFIFERCIAALTLAHYSNDDAGEIAKDQTTAVLDAAQILGRLVEDRALRDMLNL